ncbi:alkaline phosphatase family protein [Pseudobdellovibrio sp. HCB154]|uniref:alkaline phosphatase family protein n=1 Tax=Pseudobdellovibrio sp. HCB154 TaxID=3386277 RepID=UPI0039170D1D
MKNSLFLVIAIVLGLVPAMAKNLSFETYKQKPKLVVVVVIDQFRSDFLTRYQKDFMPESKLGFNHMMSTGAYFAQSSYGIMQAMTCPGHAMILSGSYPAQTGIQINEWYDTKTKKKIYCADDAEFGFSPRRLKTTTYGDEVKNIYPDSKVFTVSLKDRSAIFLGGHRADMAVWYEDKPKEWQTTGYYGKVPAWIEKVNAKQRTLPNLEDKNLEAAIAGVNTTMDMAVQALTEEKLGQRNTNGPDILGVSMSNHDILGHKLGPDAPELKTLTLEEDKQLAKLYSALKSKNLLDKTIVVLTADHGIPPAGDLLRRGRIATGELDFLGAIKQANAKLTKELGSSGDTPWIESVFLSHVYLNRARLAEKNIDPAKAQDMIKDIFLQLPGIYKVVTREQVLKAQIPYFDLRWPVENSFVPDVAGDLMLIPEPFFAQKTGATVNHMTNWNYDNSVPVIMWGPKWFQAGVYAGSRIVDIAPTLSFVSGVLPPAKASGRVLDEAFKQKN